MRARALTAVVFSCLLAGAAFAQNPSSAPPQNNGQGGYRQRGGRGFGGGMGIAGGRGVMGTVTEVAADHYVVKSEDGQTYLVHFSVNTRIMKQPAGSRGFGSGMRRGEGQGSGQDFGGEGALPETIKAADIKIGDAIGAMGEMDQSAKSIGAVAVVLLDPESARQMEEMRANYGKTWLLGKVTAIDGVKVTLLGSVDNAPHSFVADENTTFRKRRDPITLADISVGDMVRAEGSLKASVFTANTVNVMGMPTAGAESGPPNRTPPSQ